MIKNKKDIGGYYTPIEDWREVYYALRKKGYGTNWDFVRILSRNIKAHTFCWSTHKSLKNATIKQLRKER